MKKIGIVMGSDSDLPVIEKAVSTLKELEIPYEAHIYSAHRTPEEARDFALNARKNGYGAIIACAGMAAHLAGAIAANTTLPVVGVPDSGTPHAIGYANKSGVPFARAFIKYTPTWARSFTPERQTERDMFNTFNMGVGMSIVVPKEDSEKALEILNSCGEDAYVIGKIVESEDKITIC